MSSVHDPIAGRDESSLLDRLIPIVGDLTTLERLHDHPLPDESFDLTCVQTTDREFVSAVLVLSDRCCIELLDIEFRTIARRILARVARRDPSYLRRNRRADRLAAALVYLAGRANLEFGRTGRKNAHYLWSWWGLPSCADRARTLQAAAGLEPAGSTVEDHGYDALALGDATLLHSKFRQLLCLRRDLVKQCTPRPKLIVLPGTGVVRIEAEQVKPVIVTKGMMGSRVGIVVGLGETMDDADFFGLSVPDARELAQQLQNALDAPAPRLDLAGYAEL